MMKMLKTTKLILFNRREKEDKSIHLRLGNASLSGNQLVLKLDTCTFNPLIIILRIMNNISHIYKYLNKKYSSIYNNNCTFRTI